MSLQGIFDPKVRTYFKNKYGGGEADHSIGKLLFIII